MIYSACSIGIGWFSFSHFLIPPTFFSSGSLFYLKKAIYQVCEKRYIFSRSFNIFHKNQLLMNRIKEALEEKGTKQIWLAEKLDKSYSVVNGYVQNR